MSLSWVVIYFDNSTQGGATEGFQQHYARSSFLFKTPYFIIIHLAFITVTHYRMCVRSLHLRGPPASPPEPSVVTVARLCWGCGEPGVALPGFWREASEGTVTATLLGTVSAEPA